MIKKGATSIVDVYKGTQLIEKVYKGAQLIFDPYTTLTGALPLSFNARVAGALKNYRLYGDSDGSGVETENLFDKDAKDTSKGYIEGFYINSNSGMITNENWCISEYISIDRNINQDLYLYNVNETAVQPSIVFYDANKAVIDAQNYNGRASISVSIPNDAKYFRASVRLNVTEQTVIKYGSTVPTTYIPFEYKIPILNTSGVTENEFPFAEKRTITWGNGTITSDGKGNFSIRGEVTGYSPTISLTEPYTIPTSIEQGGDYCFYIGNSEYVSNLEILFYDAYDTLIENWLCSRSWRKITGYINMAGKTIAKIGFRYTTPMILSVNVSPMFSKNDNLTTYIPHRYTSNYDLFIGDSKLGATEYLDFSEQKIYKDVAGTLTPTDPPVPLPAINAYKGENTLSSTETVGEVTVKGRISEVQNG